ncbi:MAG: beta-propeller fold lactonase family protein [Pseudobdellovibrio sp.]
MLKKKLIKNLSYFGLAALSILFTLTQCAKTFDGEAFAPSNAVATVKTVTANGGGALYCSISGGCPAIVTGSDFYSGAKVYFGPYECTNPVISSDHSQISCTVGPGKSGVFDVSIVNRDGKASIFDPSINPTNLKFSYASFLYVGVQDSPGKVYAYAQNPETGALLTIGGSPFSVASNNQTYGTVISPNNKFLYAANVSSGTIAAYQINAATGSLSLVATPVASGAASPNGLFFHPSGNFLYVTNQGGNSVSAFAVASDGTVTAVVGSPFSAGSASALNGLVVDPSGRHLYVASMGGTGGVVGYSIDATTGALTLLPGSPFSNTSGGFNNTGDGITIHSNGRWLYAGLVNQKRVAAFDIDSVTGVLSGIGTPILNNSTTGYTDNGGSGANISPDGLYFYGTAFSTNAAHPKKVVVYTIDQTTGDLTRASEADTGGGPNDVRVDINGLFAYTCNSSNVPSISSFSRNTTTGALSPLSPASITIPTGNGGPGIMVIQR